MRVLVVLLLAACATHETGSVTFSCGDVSCDASTQYCSIVEPSLPNGSASYTCVAADGGVPSCGSSTASSPGMCGCYVSGSGAITITSCPP
ncbi:MAG TPA: hypothetical protein VGG74_19160 [Kofleriaceae bacterium]|jgi:hypothetical protein